MYQVIISQEADNDLENLISYIALDNPYRAVSFAHEILSSAKSTLGLFPSSGRKQWGFRVLVFKGYYVFYKINEKQKEVAVLRIINPVNYNAYKDFN